MAEDFIGFHSNEINIHDYPHTSKNTGNQTFERELMSDPDTGMMVKIIDYPAGTITPEHDHNCAHGMYVIEGTLHTDKGDYEAGSFVWFPEGSTMEHGGTATEHALCVFITNKEFNINYHTL